MTFLAILNILFLGSWEAIIAVRTGSLWLFYITTTASVFIFRRTRPDMPRPYRTWGYPITPAIFILIGAIFFTSIILSDPSHTLIGLAITGLGVPVYFLWTRVRKTQATSNTP